MEPGFIIAGRYRLDRHIAAGGMGSVWAGFDLSLEREVAVKLLLRGLPSVDKPVERFEREAKALARVKNPGCVEVHDVGEYFDGDEMIRYIVMELVEGESLKDRLDRVGRLDSGEVMTRIAEAAEALGAAHGVGIVHRDIKPGNLLIDADDRTRVVDFGISTLTDSTRLTQSSAVLGTLPYVAPEQFEDQETTPKSDIYALGAVAYECLTGHPPFPGANAKAIIRGHLFVEPEPFDETVPAAIESTVMRALAKDPEQRWGSCADLAAACHAAAAGTGDAAGPAAVDEPAGAVEPDGPGADADADATVRLNPPASGRRGRRGATVLAVVSALVLLGALIIWQQWPDAREILSGAEPSDSLVSDASGTPEETPPTSPSTADSPSPSVTESASNPPAGDDASPEGQGDGTGNDEPEEGATGPADEESDPSGDPSLPDVTGDPVSNAEAELKAAGFTNLEFVNIFFNAAAPDACEVMDQDPPGGSDVAFTDEIRIEFYNPQGSGCR